MKKFQNIFLLLIGFIFGISLSKGEAISWYRIHEMFKFQSFHMYGIILSAIFIGAVLTLLIKKYHWRTIYREKIQFTPKEKGFYRYLIGGTSFGLGWALTGACPGPMFILLGHGVWQILIVIVGSLVGTFLYGLIKKHLPH